MVGSLPNKTKLHSYKYGL